MAKSKTTRRSPNKPPSRKAPAAKMSRRAATRERGMTVQEAGRKGGLLGGRKGGLAVKAERGVGYFQEIGRLGGQRVRDLIAAGRKALEKTARRRHT